MPDLLSNRLRHTTDDRFADAWQRQRRTANDILGRLTRQEGVILADQVGMGKTFVALAVAATKILAEPELGQVVVFVPSAVATKWRDEWKKFSATLLADGPPIRCVDEPIRSGEDFLKALDDPPERRRHLIVVTHTALTTTLKDPFVQLALLHYATRYQRDGAAMRPRIGKWCDGNRGLLRDARFTPDRVARLLNTPPKQWRATWHRLTGELLDDDPAPAALDDATQRIDLDKLREVVRALPVNRSADIERRLKHARTELGRGTQSTWKRMLAATNLELPLLIVDEAHRLKNDDTKISKLFAERSGTDDSGALAGIFDRMLFLTATPFELGHAELIRVLSRMSAIRPMDPPPRRTLAQRLDELRRVLDAAQASALTLDASWARLTDSDLPYFAQWDIDTPSPSDASADVRKAWRDAQFAVKARHEMHRALRPWVIRHERQRRREYYPGQGMLTGDTAAKVGIEIPEQSALPFLLAARAQSVAAEDKGASRPLFAYGIASSFEAFRRLGGPTDDGPVLDTDVAPDDQDGTAGEERSATSGSSSAAAWYRHETDRLLVDGGLDRDSHPKVSATVTKAAQLWLSGQKCLVFCWYIRTGEAVEGALGRRIETLILKTAAKALRTTNPEEARASLDRIADRLLRRDSNSYARIRQHLADSLDKAARGNTDLIGVVVDAAIRHLRTPSYLVRYTALSPAIDADQLLAGIHGENPLGIAPLERWQDFTTRLSAMGSDERDRFVAALLGADRAGDDAGASGGASLAPVRRAHGGTERERRERLIKLFNTPFAPDLLVASSVMGEGIDLHQECRHVLHHDLDWNPSVLEQRTGRLDRIGSLAEREKAQIDVYEPYLAGTHDEKMFKVVKDRSQWFDIVMGRASVSDENTTDAEENRIPLHPRILEALTMDLTSPKQR